MDSPYIFFTENTRGEKVTLRACFFVCILRTQWNYGWVYFSPIFPRRAFCGRNEIASLRLCGISLVRGVYFSPDFSMTRRDAIVLRPVSRGVSYVSYVLMSKRINPPARGSNYVWSYPTFGDILQHPWLAATPPIFSIRKTQGGSYFYILNTIYLPGRS